MDGAQIWDLFQRMTGQLRVSNGCVFGVDMSTAFAMAAALGINTFLLAELFPAMEAALVNRLNERIAAKGDSQIMRTDSDD